MTPKEKAKQLVNKFLRTYKVSLFPPFNKASQEAKLCALIAVEEILKAIQVPPIENKGHALYDSQVVFWQQVKQEIENL